MGRAGRRVRELLVVGEKRMTAMVRRDRPRVSTSVGVLISLRAS